MRQEWRVLLLYPELSSELTFGGTSSTVVQAVMRQLPDYEFAQGQGRLLVCGQGCYFHWLVQSQVSSKQWFQGEQSLQSDSYLQSKSLQDMMPLSAPLLMHGQATTRSSSSLTLPFRIPLSLRQHLYSDLRARSLLEDPLAADETTFQRQRADYGVTRYLVCSLDTPMPYEKVPPLLKEKKRYWQWTAEPHTKHLQDLYK